MIFTPRVNEVLETNFKLGGGGILHFIRWKLLSKVGFISIPCVPEFCLKAICLLVNHVHPSPKCRRILLLMMGSSSKKICS